MGLLDKAKARQTQHRSGGLLARAADLSKQQVHPAETAEKKKSSRRMSQPERSSHRP